MEKYSAEQDMTEIPPISPEALQNPKAAIMGIMQEVGSMGRNDAELSDLTEILNAIAHKDVAKRITPEEAVTRAYAIRYGKQDYN